MNSNKDEEFHYFAMEEKDELQGTHRKARLRKRSSSLGERRIVKRGDSEEYSVFGLLLCVPVMPGSSKLFVFKHQQFLLLHLGSKNVIVCISV
jgi:hypothetical protein